MINHRTDCDKMFLQVGFTEFEKLLNLVIEGKLSSKQLLVFLWMASFAWKTNGRKRNYFQVPISGVAHSFEVERSTVEKWMGKLRSHKLVKPRYRVKLNTTGETKVFSKHEAAWMFKNENHGDLLPTHYEILSETIKVLVGQQVGKDLSQKNTNSPIRTTLQSEGEAHDLPEHTV